MSSFSDIVPSSLRIFMILLMSMILENFLIQTYLSLKCTNYKIWPPSKRSKAGEKSIVLVCFLRISSWKVHKNQLFYFLHIFWSIHFCRSILEYLWFLLASYASNNHQKHFGSQPLVLNVFLPFSPLQYRPNKPTFLLSKPLIHGDWKPWYTTRGKDLTT